MTAPDAILRDTKHRDCRPGETCRVIPVPTHACKGKCSCTPGVEYLRVSKIMKREELLSPELQDHDIGMFCEREKIRVVKIICDINKSGQSFTERRVGEIIEDIEAGHYTQVVMLHWDRWGRNNQESQLYLHLVKEAGGRVRASAEDFDTEDDIGEFVVGQMLLLAQLKGRQIGKGWKRVHNHRRQAGLPHSAQRRFGYTYSKDRGYVANINEAVLLITLYEEFVAGKPMRYLAMLLNEKNIPTMTGKRWSPMGLRKMLDTGFAAGYIRERSKPPTNSRRGGASTMKAYDVWRKGSHKPLISEDLWKRYCAKRESTAGIAPRLRVATHALSGMLYCGLCESVGKPTRLVSGYSGKHRKHSWLCPRGRDKEHRFVSISNSRAMEKVWNWVEAEVGKAHDVDAQAKQIARATLASQNLGHLKSEITRLVKRRKAINSRLTDADLDDREDLQEQLDEVKAELAHATKALSEAEVVSGGDFVEAFTTLSEEWAKFTPQEHNRILSKVVRRAIVHPGPPGSWAQTVEIIPTFG